MHRLRTAVIQHTDAHGTHHDWLIQDPRLPNPHAADARLWTARVGPHPAHWLQLGRFDLAVIPPHRRRYLNFQGPISHRRGRVRRVAQGNCDAPLWRDSRIVLHGMLNDHAMYLTLLRLSPDRWLAVVQPG